MSTAQAVLKPRALLALLRSDRMLRNNAIFLTGSVLAGALGYVFHFETGHLLGPSNYAIVASAIAGLYLLTLPVVGLQLVSARYASLLAARNQQHAIVRMLLQITLFSLAAAVPIAVLLIVFAPAAAAFFNIPDPRIVWVLALAAISALLVTINRGALQGLQRFVALSANIVIDMVSRLAIAGVLIAASFGAAGAVGAIALGPTVAYAATFLVLRHPRSEEQATERVEGLGSYALLATVASVGINYLFSIDTLLAKHYLSPDSAGLYAASAVLARVVYFLGVSIAGVMFPEVAALHARNEKHFHVVDRSIALVAATGIALIVAYTLVPGLVLLPYGPGFAGARPYLGTFALALALLAIGNLFTNYFLSIAKATLIIPLLLACVAETALIALFHASMWQILIDVVVSLGMLAAVTSGMYLSDRFFARATSE